jgi:hypothetical protein
MSRERRPWILLSLALAGVLVASRVPLRAGTPGEIQFQSRLVDSTGTPREGTFTLVFSLYRSQWIPPATPVLSDLVWTETHTGVKVSKGILSVRLGSRGTPFDPSVFDGGTKYLQVQVQGDPTALPDAIPFVSVPYALSAASINGVSDQNLVPVGTVVDWFRPNSSMLTPTGWTVCDGSLVTDASAPLFNGKHVPDLRNRFVLGIDPGNMTVMASYGADQGAPPQGGQASVSASLAHSHGIGAHTHTIQSHTHTFTTSIDGDHFHDHQNDPFQSGFIQGAVTGGQRTTTNGAHSHHGTTDGSGTLTTDPTALQTDTQLSNVTIPTMPPYVGLLKIIRIK